MYMCKCFLLDSIFHHMLVCLCLFPKTTVKLATQCGVTNFFSRGNFLSGQAQRYTTSLTFTHPLPAHCGCITLQDFQAKILKFWLAGKLWDNLKGGKCFNRFQQLLFYTSKFIINITSSPHCSAAIFFYRRWFKCGTSLPPINSLQPLNRWQSATEAQPVCIKWAV